MRRDSKSEDRPGPDEVAELIALLVSGKAAAMHGAECTIDGTPSLWRERFRPSALVLLSAKAPRIK